MSNKRDSTLEAPSHSRLSRFHECRRAYYYKYVRGLRAKGTYTRPQAGKALHAGLDVLYRGGDADEAHRAIIAAYKDHKPGKPFEWLTTEHLMGIMVNYLHRWIDEVEEWRPWRFKASELQDNPAVLYWGGTVDPAGYVSMVEEPMVVRLGNGMCVTVVIDNVMERNDGTLWVWDHKATCGYLGKGVLNKYLVSHQPPLYIEAVKAIFGRCEGALLNAIFMGQAANNPGSKAVKFDRYPFDYTAGQLAESLSWARATQDLARHEEAVCQNDEAMWLQNPQAYCAGCDYLQLCEVGPAVREGRITNWYDTYNADNLGDDDGQAL